MGQSDKVIAVVDDMFFAAKINGAASAAGREIRRVKSREELERELFEGLPALVILDLNSARLDPLEAIGLMKSRPEFAAVPVVGFVSHVETELIRRAQGAGCDYVLPRSAFASRLIEIVSGNLDSLGQRHPG